MQVYKTKVQLASRCRDIVYSGIKWQDFDKEALRHSAEWHLAEWHLAEWHATTNYIINSDTHLKVASARDPLMKGMALYI